MRISKSYASPGTDVMAPSPQPLLTTYRESFSEVVTLSLPPLGIDGVELSGDSHQRPVVTSVDAGVPAAGVLRPGDIVLSVMAGGALARGRDSVIDLLSRVSSDPDAESSVVTVARGFEARTFPCHQHLSIDFSGPVDQIKFDQPQRHEGVMSVKQPWRERHADPTNFFSATRQLTATVYTEVIAAGDLLLSIDGQPAVTPHDVRLQLEAIRRKANNKGDPFEAIFEVARPYPSWESGQADDDASGWHQLALVRAGGKILEQKRVMGERTDWKQFRNPGLSIDSTRETRTSGSMARASVEPLSLEHRA